jgi:hypothetical protein
MRHLPHGGVNWLNDYDEEAPKVGGDQDKMNDVLRRMLSTPLQPASAPKAKKSSLTKRGQGKR